MSNPVLALIVTLGVLITVHEFGHFWVARRLGVKVLRFSIGFGRPLWRRCGKDGVEYVIAALPLGGYVRMLDEREGDVPPNELHQAFNRQAVGTRIAIVLAGPLCNFLFAVVVYSLMYMVGVHETKPLLDEPAPESVAMAGGFRKGDLIIAIDGESTPTLNEALLTLMDRALAEQVVKVEVRDVDNQVRVRILNIDHAEGAADAGLVFDRLGLVLLRPVWPAVVGEVVRDSAAERADLHPGDRLLQADGELITDWQQWRQIVERRPEQTLTVKIEREGVEQTLEITPEVRENSQGQRVGFIGAKAKVPLVRYGPLDAIGAAIGKTWQMSVLTLRMLGRMLVGKVSLDNLSGPLTIAQFAGQAAGAGLMAFLSLLALVSISLGVLNLLPVPVLDGGHLLYYLIELVKGSPLSEAIQNAGQRVGIVVLLLLMGLALFNDFNRLLLG